MSTRKCWHMIYGVISLSVISYLIYDETKHYQNAKMIYSAVQMTGFFMSSEIFCWILGFLHFSTVASILSLLCLIFNVGNYLNDEEKLDPSEFRDREWIWSVKNIIILTYRCLPPIYGIWQWMAVYSLTCAMALRKVYFSFVSLINPVRHLLNPSTQEICHYNLSFRDSDIFNLKVIYFCILFFLIFMVLSRSLRLFHCLVVTVVSIFFIFFGILMFTSQTLLTCIAVSPFSRLFQTHQSMISAQQLTVSLNSNTAAHVKNNVTGTDTSLFMILIGGFISTLFLFLCIGLLLVHIMMQFTRSHQHDMVHHHQMSKTFHGRSHLGALHRLPAALGLLCVTISAICRCPETLASITILKRSVILIQNPLSSLPVIHTTLNLVFLFMGHFIWYVCWLKLMCRPNWPPFHKITSIGVLSIDLRDLPLSADMDANIYCSLPTDTFSCLDTPMIKNRSMSVPLTIRESRGDNEGMEEPQGGTSLYPDCYGFMGSDDVFVDPLLASMNEMHTSATLTRPNLNTPAMDESQHLMFGPPDYFSLPRYPLPAMEEQAMVDMDLPIPLKHPFYPSDSENEAYHDQSQPPIHSVDPSILYNHVE